MLKLCLNANAEDPERETLLYAGTGENRSGGKNVIETLFRRVCYPRFFAFLPLAFLLLDYGTTGIALGYLGFVETNPVALSTSVIAFKFFLAALTFGCVWFTKKYAELTSSSKLHTVALVISSTASLFFLPHLFAGIGNIATILRVAGVL